MTSPYTGPVLYVEDDENDVALLRVAFRRAEISAPLLCIADTSAALDYVAGQGDYSERHKHPLPTLILLDVGLRGASGLDLLRALQTRGVGSSIPIIVLTASTNVAHQHKAAYLGAAAYWLKPPDLEGYVTLATVLRDKWLT